MAKIAIVLGTRPEIIKMAPVAKELDRRGAEYFIIHTGQHYDFNMDKIFFNELGLKPGMINLDVGSGSHGETTAKIITGIEKIFSEARPDVVLVQGDTNTVLAAAIASSKLHIPIGHIEAGLRSYDRRMPEEYNRIICDHISDYLFAPTKLTENNLHEEGISRTYVMFYDKIKKPVIALTGNTIVDAINQNFDKADKSLIFQTLEIEKGKYFLVTAHREENVDNKGKLLGIIRGIRKLSDKYGVPIIYPIHPRTQKMLERFGIEKELHTIKNLKIIKPVGFFDLLALETNARLVITDSGGIQEETCCLKVPCVVIRDRSDRQESIDVGASMLAGTDPDKILLCAEEMLSKPRDWKNPFGDGKASERIVDHILNA